MKPLRQNQILQSQRGAFMIDVSLALIVSAIATGLAMQMSADSARMGFARVQGSNMAVLSAVGAKYTSEFFPQLQSGAAVTKNGVTLTAGNGVGQTYAPTIANLKALGYLNADFSEQSTYSNGSTAPGLYRFKLARTPAGCELVAVTTCDIEGFVYPDQPITIKGSTDPDGPSIAALMEPLLGDGGFSLNVNSAVVTGVGGGWTTPNPIPGNPAGTVVARFGYGSSGLSNFVRMNDTRDPNLQGNLTVLGNSRSATFATDVKSLNSACSVPNAIASGVGTVMICSNGTWQALTTRAAPGSACATTGQVATSTVTNEQLFCKNSVYVKTRNLIPQNVLMSRTTVRDLDVVAKPVCDSGGTADRSFTLTQISTDVSIAPPKQSMYVATVDQGSSWQVVIRLRDDLGGENSGNLYNVSAILNVECKY